jgi:dephospho-CoA kinase
MPMLVIGLTGGIGSGTTTVARLFAKKGVPIIDADEIAHDITKPHEYAYQEIVKHFGSTVLHRDQTLNRKKLSKMIFTDPIERHWLEQLLHPLIKQVIQHRIQAISARYCIIMIPLLLEVTPDPFVHRILVIDSKKIIRIQRIKERDRIKTAHIKAILRTQIRRQERLARADDIIINNGLLADLLPQVEKLHQLYQQISDE